MTLTMTVHLWWAIPLAVTICSFGWVHWMTRNDTGNFSALRAALCAIPALFVSMAAWIIGAICK